MAVFRIDLNFYGPFGSLGAMQEAIRKYDETRLVYMALRKNLGAFAKGRALTGKAASRAWIREKCEVAYVGVTQQQDLAHRFYGHHKMVKEVEELGLPTLSRFWMGFLYRNAPSGTKGRRLEKRLTIAEKMLIAWFLPPLNDDHIARTGTAEYGKDMIASAELHFVWWTPDEKELKQGLPGFPASLHYNGAAEEISAIF